MKLLFFVAALLAATLTFAQGGVQAQESEYDQYDTANFPLECGCDDFVLAYNLAPGAKISSDSITLEYKENSYTYSLLESADIVLVDNPRRVRLVLSDGQKKTIVCQTETPAKRKNIGKKIEYSGDTSGSILLVSLNGDGEVYNLGKYNPNKAKIKWTIPSSAQRPGYYLLHTPSDVIEIVHLKEL